MTPPDRDALVRVMADAITRAADIARSPAGVILPLAGVKLTPAEIVSYAALAALEAAGVVLMPAEATEKMHHAARDWSYAKYGKPIGLDASKGCWDAMVANSPYRSST